MIYQSVIKDGPFGYACHEIIFNNEGNPADFRIIDHNQIYESLTDLKSGSVTGKKISELSRVKGKNRNDIIALYDRISSDGENDKIEFYSDSLKHWYDVKVLKDIDGLLITLFEDITYLKSLQTDLDNTGYLLIENERLSRLTRSLAQSEESYKSLFDYAIVAIYVLEENGIFIAVNDAATKMYGYNREEMIGYTPEKLSAPGRNDIEKTLRNIQKAFKGEPQRFEWWGLRKNGEVFPKDVVLNKGLYFGKDVVFAMARDNTELFQTLDALKESEDKFRSLSEQLPVGVYRTTIDGKIVYTNMALVRILDYDSVDEFLKINVNQLYTNPLNRQDQLKNTDKRAGVDQSEFQLKKKNGELIWVRDNSRLIYDKDGNPEYFDGVLDDITEERNSQLAVKENEANLKAIIENTLESIWSVNLNYEIQYVNEVFANSFKETFGVSLCPGVNIIESLPVSIQYIWKERYDKAFKNNHFLFEDKIGIDNKSIYIEVAMNPIVIDGKVVGVSVYGRNVTQKKLVEIQLHYQSDLRKLLAEVSSGFINIPLRNINEAINQSLVKIGEFVGADRVYILEYDFNKNTITNTFEWCGLNIEPAIDKVQNHEMDSFEEFVQAHIRGDIFKLDEVSLMPENGLRKILEDQNVLSLLTIPLIMNGGCIGSVGFDSVRKSHVYNESEQQLLQIYAQMLVNVLERLEKEEKLVAAKEKAEESDRLKSAFLANMSHEIRTPMSGIIGFLNLLNEPDLSDENKSVYINIVTQSGHRLLDTINDIIEVSKIESGSLQVNM